MTKEHFSRLTLLVLTVLLTACSGSNSGEKVDSTDAGGLSVITTLPVDGSQNVIRSTSITGTFNKVLFALSVDNKSFNLSDGNSVIPLSPQLDSETAKTVSLAGSTLRNLTTYTASLTTDITDLTGDALNELYAWRFTTEDGQWGTVEEINSDGESASYPQISKDPSGNATAVWMQNHQGQGRIWTNRYHKASNSWGVASLIDNTATGGSALFPKISIDNNGNGLAVWKQEQGLNFNTYSIWSSHYDFSDDTWSAPLLIGPENEDSVAYADIAFDSQGNAIAVWNQSESDQNSIWVNHYNVANNSWGDAVAIEQSDQTTYEPNIAVDQYGNALVVWHQREGLVKSIWANHYDADSNNWGIPAKVETGEGDARLTDGIQNAQVAIDAEGNGIAVWSQHDGTADSIWVNHFDLATKSWGSEKMIEAEEGDARAPKIATDGLGNAMVLWYQDNGSIDTTRFNRYNSATNSWGAASEIEAGAGHAYKHQLVFDASNNALAIWRQADGGVFSIRAIRYSAITNRWGASVKIESDSGGVGYPQLSIDGFGNALAIWQQDDSALAGIQNNIKINHFD